MISGAPQLTSILLSHMASQKTHQELTTNIRLEEAHRPDGDNSC